MFVDEELFAGILMYKTVKSRMFFLATLKAIYTDES